MLHEVDTTVDTIGCQSNDAHGFIQLDINTIEFILKGSDSEEN